MRYMNLINRTTLAVNTSYESESIEQKVERIVNNKEAIKDGAPLIYTDREDGVQAGYDIRTDRFDVAVEAMDRVSKSNIAKRNARIEARKKAKEEAEGKPAGAGEGAEN